MSGAFTAWRGLGLAAALCAPLVATQPARATGAVEVRQVLDRLAAGDRGGAALATRDPLLLTYVEWRSLRDGPPPDYQRTAAFLQAHAGWPDSIKLQARAEAAMDLGVSPEERRRFFATRPPRTGAGRAALLTALDALGQDAEAAALARQVWVADDRGALDEAVFVARWNGALTAADHSARLDRLLWDGRTGDALRMLPLVGPDDRAVATARLAIQQRTRGADAALAAVPPGRRDDPGLAFDLVKLRRDRGQTAAVEALLLGVRSEATQPAAWWAERNKAVRRALDDGDRRRAYALASSHKLVEGQPFGEAEWLAGWIALRGLEDPPAALAHFQRFTAKVATPISKARGAYWAGRALAASGDQAGAARAYAEAARHPTTFYGQQAAAELGQTLRLSGANPVPPDAAGRQRFRQRGLAQLAELFCAAGAERESVPFLRQLGADAGKAQDKLELVYDLARRCARPDLVVTVAKANVQAGADPLATFPVPDVAAMLSPPDDRPEPELLLAIARQESQFDPDAVSPSGARGLMQLMPATAREVARKLGVPFEVATLNGDPDYNVQLGSWYLGQQLERFDGSVPLAAAAYNAGPGRVNEWLGRFGDPRGADRAQLIDWIEQIPFTETRNYVQRVIEGQAVYRALLAEGGGRLVPLEGARQGTAALRKDPRS